MADAPRFTAEQLAQLTGIPLRTVRYYVAEGLIERPVARGPGAHFTEKHLTQLKRILLLQQSGFDLETIRDKGASLQPILNGMFDAVALKDIARVQEFWRAWTGKEYGAGLRNAPNLSATLRAQLAGSASRKRPGEVRVPMAEGIDIVVDTSAYDMASPKELVDIALLIRKTFDPLKKRHDDDD
jgi:MerR HTH family regulatory protein